MKLCGSTNHPDATYQKLAPLEKHGAAVVKLGQPTKVIASTVNIAGAQSASTASISARNWAWVAQPICNAILHHWRNEETYTYNRSNLPPILFQGLETQIFPKPPEFRAQECSNKKIIQFISPVLSRWVYEIK
jgi:hypothetical protein